MGSEEGREDLLPKWKKTRRISGKKTALLERIYNEH